MTSEQHSTLTQDDSTAFWIVWSPTGGSPLHRHLSLELAHDEAKRLAEKFPGRHFFVLQCLGYEMTGEEAQMTAKLRKGTIIHVQGVPFTLLDGARIKGANVAAISGVGQ